MTSKRLLSLLLLAAFGAGVQAKLPAPVLDDAAKAKAAETAARTAWQAKVDAYKLCQVQDRVAAKYKGGGGAKDAKPVPVAAKAASAPAAAASGTPVATAMPGPCPDPGPFAYSPPAQKPLETSGAHSPASNAASPPSVRSESAQMAPAKPSTGPAAGAPAAKKP